MRRNPLTGYELHGATSPARLSPPLRMLVGKNAKAVYTKELEGVPFPMRLVVVVLDSSVRGERFREAVTHNLSVAMREAALTGDNIVVSVIPEMDPNVPQERDQRGSPFRVSPMTPFTVLHRMYDAIIGDSASSMSEILGPNARKYSDLYDANKNLELQAGTLANDVLNKTQRYRSSRERDILTAKILSVGVNTAAGRMGVLGDPTQVLADLFALRAKTGRWDYNWNEQPSIKGPDYAITAWSPKMLAARQAFSDTGVEFISDIIFGLSWGGHAFAI